MFRDEAGLFRKMWSAEPFTQRQPNRPNCWDRARDDARRGQDPEVYFEDAINGAHCESNWYEGNPDNLGLMHTRPSYSADAPALLGFDETIDDYCRAQPEVNSAAAADGGNWHASRCIAANLNILSLYGTRVPYNICRNLEWQVCAAMGTLPGQRTPQIVFSKAPREMDPGPESDKPFGQCRGWRDRNDDCENGYATDDIFFLELCMYNAICDNRDSLWQLDVGTPWQCHLNRTRFDGLRQTLLAEPNWGSPQGVYPVCDKWCNKWTCMHPRCTGCEDPSHSERNIECVKH